MPAALADGPRRGAKGLAASVVPAAGGLAADAIGAGCFTDAGFAASPADEASLASCSAA